MAIRTRPLCAYAILLMILASCGHERPRRSYPYNANHQSLNTQSIPWVDQQSPSRDQFLFADVPIFATDKDENKKDGASQNNIITDREVWNNIVASLPYAMPFFCDPACYEPNIILSIQACQPYLFVLFYYYSLPVPPDRYEDDDFLIYYEPGLPYYPGRPLANKNFAPPRRRGYCVGR